MDAYLEKMETCMRELKVTDLKANPEAVEQQEICNEEMNVDTILALED
jgi:hypothetical protein